MSKLKKAIVVGVNTALKNASAPNLSTILGRQFLFHSEYGSHVVSTAGTVMGLSLSDEGGLELFVNTPSFANMPLISLCFRHEPRGWCANIARNNADLQASLARLPDEGQEDAAEKLIREFMESRFYQGELVFL